MDNLLHNRAILLAAMKEVLGLADCYDDPMKRKPYVLEATRLGLRLLEVQKKIEDNDLD